MQKITHFLLNTLPIFYPLVIVGVSLIAQTFLEDSDESERMK